MIEGERASLLLAALVSLRIRGKQGGTFGATAPRTLAPWPRFSARSTASRSGCALGPTDFVD